MASIGRVFQNSASKRPTSAKAVESTLFEQLGSTGVVVKSSVIEIELPDGDTDPDLEPLPDYDE